MVTNRLRILKLLRSLWSETTLAAKRRRETKSFSNHKKQKWIEDYVDRDATVARKRVEETETAIQQAEDDMSWAEIEGLRGQKPEKIFAKMLNAIGDSLSDVASSNDDLVGKLKTMTMRIQSRARWAKITNLAGWWVQCRKRYSTAWRCSAEPDKLCGNDQTGMGGCGQWLLWEIYEVK